MKIEHFKKKLEEEKTRLETELGNIGRRNPAVPDDWEMMPMEMDNESDLLTKLELLQTVRMISLFLPIWNRDTTPFYLRFQELKRKLMGSVKSAEKK